MLDETTSVVLPSGATLRIMLPAFAVSKRLFQALMREAIRVQVNGASDVRQVLKDAFCVGFSSPEVDQILSECLKKCTIDYVNGVAEPIRPDTFEPAETRGDYMKVCAEVIKANTYPFVKSLYADFLEMVRMIEGIQPSQSTMTT